MALYFQTALASEDGIFQNDKTRGKNFFSNTVVRGTLTRHATVSVPSAVLTVSYPLNTDIVKLKNISIDKTIHMEDGAGHIIYNDVELVNFLLPAVHFDVLIGIADQPTNANIINRTEFNKQQQIFIPALVAADGKHFNFPVINEYFLLSKNQSYLNIFVSMRVESTGDITQYRTDFNATAAPISLGDLFFDFSIFIAGKTHLNKNKLVID